jgi:hypothetical protein
MPDDLPGPHGKPLTPLLAKEVAAHSDDGGGELYGLVPMSGVGCCRCCRLSYRMPTRRLHRLASGARRWAEKQSQHGLSCCGDRAAVGHLRYVVLLPSVDRCVDQVATRSGHGFTGEAATRHMHRQFARAQIDHRHVLADPTGPPDETAAEILKRVQDGALRYP